MPQPERGVVGLMAVTTAASFCATLVDEWLRSGVTDAVVAPGSRSTPLALALADAPDMRVHVVHDERSASFTALGLGLATGRPAVVLCTSGTAATHFHGAVVEAHLSAVPMVVCTADRPPELWDVGAPQTIDQTGLYGSAVRWFCEPGVPDDAAAPSWRSLASRGVAEACGWSGRPGPVHYNLSFRDPLVGQPGELPPGRSDGRPWHETAPPVSTAPDVTELASRMAVADGVIVAGRGVSDPTAVVDLAERLGWPLLADHRSGCRSPGRSIAYADLLLRTEAFVRRRPAFVLRFGQPPASKVVGQWLAGSDAETIAAVPDARWIDPERIAARVLPERGVAAAMLSGLGPGDPASREAATWTAADQLVDELLDRELTGRSQPTEPGVARAVVDAVPSGGSLVVASSMPMRDVEWFGRARADIDVFANRGANGIDGVTSTAAGVALAGRPTVCLLGDIAFLHDSAALTALSDRTIDLTLVVVDNDGGGIFSFLPQADSLDPARFEQLFGTPHGTDLPALAAAHGIPASAWGEDNLQPDGVRVVVVGTDRVANRAVHRELVAATAAAVDSAP
jgi:2-succinyl-5-enolpyruvyl-6-hydroxy-3-cyclohexene-1-carboxylate synthase